MLPDHGFAEFVAAGQRAGFADEDLALLRAAIPKESG